MARVADWPVEVATAGAIAANGTRSSFGNTARPFEVASITKLFTAVTVLIAAEEGTVTLDDPVGPPGSTLAHLLAHASGLGPDGDDPLARPGQRRIYSNRGYEVAADHVADRAGFPFADYQQEALFSPLAMHTTSLYGSPAHGAASSVDDLLVFVHAVLTDTVMSAQSRDRFATAQWPDLDGVLPGYGRQSPNLWGLGAEIRGSKSPHWTSAANSPGTWGHFGQKGTMLWHDPLASTTLVALTAQPFGPWALTAWPDLSTAVLAAN
ncbi:MAG: beta-lactamase family protein [Acidimicrobiales bacterium]|nr:beta-lactamase family protein [Acidimicrobiales bacterium]